MQNSSNHDKDKSIYFKIKDLLENRFKTDDFVYNFLSNDKFTNSFDFNLHKLPATRKSTSVTAIKHLNEAYLNGNLTLVLGAGISSDFGIPSWENLLQRLLMTTIEEETEKAILVSKLFSKIFNPIPVIAGRYLESSFKDEKINNKFEKRVRDALYETYLQENSSKILEEIVRFCLAPGNSPNLDSIITYNYDDILEQKLRDKELDLQFESVYGQAIDPDYSVLKIYHVHGFLPKNGNIGPENKITLGEFVYHEQYTNIYSWNNIVQINKFRDKTCLFIGTSLTDPNIRRLLDIARSQKKSSKFHYIFKKRIDKKWLKESINKAIGENKELTEVDTPNTSKIDDIIDYLIELKSRFEEKDSESLGVKTVWIDDYEKDISAVLKKIRLESRT